MRGWAGLPRERPGGPGWADLRRYFSSRRHESTGLESIGPRTSIRQAGRSLRFEKSDALRRRAHALIPGGAHTYAKGDDQYPQEAPGFIVRGAGCHVWDADGNE